MPDSTRNVSGLRIGGPRRRARAASQYRRTVTRAAATRSSRIVRSRRSTSNGSVVSAAKYSRAIVAIGRPSTRAPRPDFGAAVGARREAASVAAGGSISVRLPRLAPPHRRRMFPPISRRRRRRASRSRPRATRRSSVPRSLARGARAARQRRCRTARCQDKPTMPCTAHVRPRCASGMPITATSPKRVATANTTALTWPGAGRAGDFMAEERAMDSCPVGTWHDDEGQRRLAPHQCEKLAGAGLIVNEVLLVVAVNSRSPKADSARRDTLCDQIERRVDRFTASRKAIPALSAQRIPSSLEYFFRQRLVIDHARHHQRTDHG